MTPIETSLPFPNPQQNLRIQWPEAGALNAINGAFNVAGMDQGFGVPSVWGAATGAGTNVMQLRHDLVCAQFDDTVFRGIEPYCMIKPTVAGLGAGYVGLEYQRVFRFTVQLSMDGILDQGDGFQFGPSDDLDPKFTEGGQAAFGVVGDGAGGWEYLQSDTGAFPGNITDQVAIGVGIVVDATDWNTFQFEFINSAFGRTATFALTVNGTSVVSRNWVAPLALPLFTEIANGNKFVGGARCEAVGVDLFVGPWEIQMGRFTAGGLEILS